MKQAHDEIIANWLPRQAKLKAAFTNKAQPIEYRAKAFRLYFLLTVEIATVTGQKKDEVLKSFPRGGISYEHPTGEPEPVILRSQWENTEGGEYIVNAEKVVSNTTFLITEQIKKSFRDRWGKDHENETGFGYF